MTSSRPDRSAPSKRLPPGAMLGFGVALMAVASLPFSLFVARSAKRKPAPPASPPRLVPVDQLPEKTPRGEFLSGRDGELVKVDNVNAATEAAKAQPGLIGGVKEMFNKFSDDDGMTQAAALAFYTGLAIAPLLTVIVWITTLFISDGATDRVTEIATTVVGPQAAAPIKDLLKPASAQAGGGMTLTGILSILFLMFTASSVLAQLQASLNLIWRVKPDPKISGIVTLVRKRVFSFGMLFTILFLLMVSMMATVAIQAMFSGEVQQQAVAKAEAATTTPSTIPATIPVAPMPAPADVGAPGTAASIAAATRIADAHAATRATTRATTRAATQAAQVEVTAAKQAVAEAKKTQWLFQLANVVVSLVVATGVFMLLFAYLPDARVPWKDTFFGAALTAVLFIIGRYLMGWYLGRGSYETSYGAAVGSFLALLVWVYYTSIIIFIGTEATQVYARRHGNEPKPEKHAVKTERIENTISPAKSKA